MFKQISTQATALGLAALVTLATLGSLQNLAAAEHGSNLTGGDATVQQVVVVGQRPTRT